MPLPPPAPREHIHTRTVECTGYRREDGQWDIEGHLTDIKTYAFRNNERGEIPPGEPIHDMWVRLTVNDAFEITEVAAEMDHTPFAICQEVPANFQRLVGLRVGPGWRRAVRERLGGVEGCTHMVELLAPVATTAFQTIYPLLRKEKPEMEAPSGRPPRLLNTCHAFRDDGSKVKEIWPEWYRAPEAADGAG